MDSPRLARGETEDFQATVVQLLSTQNTLLERILRAVEKEPGRVYSDKELSDLAVVLAWRNASNLSHARIAEQMTAMTNRTIHRTGLIRNKNYARYREVYNQLIGSGQAGKNRGWVNDDGSLEAYHS